MDRRRREQQRRRHELDPREGAVCGYGDGCTVVDRNALWNQDRESGKCGCRMTICRPETNIRQAEFRQGAWKDSRPRMRSSLGEQCFGLFDAVGTADAIGEETYGTSRGHFVLGKEAKKDESDNGECGSS